VESLKDDYEIKLYTFAHLTPKSANDGIFQVSVKADKAWEYILGMSGVGPFYLVKAGADYYALTKRNFAQLFSPIEKQSEVLPYIDAFHYLFEKRLDRIVTEESGNTEYAKDQGPPEFTQIEERAEGFRIKLVTYSKNRIEAYFVKTVHVHINGRVDEVEPERMLKKIGEGIHYY